MDKRTGDRRVERMVGNVLRWGVVSATMVTAVGGALLLLGHGSEVVTYGLFRGEPDGLTGLGPILGGTLAGKSTAMVQLGVVLLIATPITRVGVTLVAFLHQRDRLYTLITSLVLGILLYSLLLGGQG
ncbi:MAG: DUF1634 domain-containing protein [Gemmatimonadota bacterium]